MTSQRDCPGCRRGDDPAVPVPVVHQPVRTYTQFMSAELIPAIVHHGADPGSDPRWLESGAHDRAEYAFWAGRACGVACLQMVLDHYLLPVPPLVPLARDALAVRPARDR